MSATTVGGAGSDRGADPAEARGLVPRDRLAAWSALLARPLLSYYLIIGISVLLLALGLIMVLST